MMNYINLSIENKPDKFDKFVFYACIIDNLFLPYVWFMSVPYTMPLIFFWMLRSHNKLKSSKDYKIFLLLLALMGISTLFGFVIAPGHIYKNTVYLILYTTMFLYYFLFTYYLSHFYVNITKFLFYFLLFIVVMAIFYNINKYFYHYLTLIWNRRSGVFINDTLYQGFIGYRYTFIWMDANNVAYIMNAIVLYLWCNEKTSILTKVFSLLSLLFILLSCMSNGGFIAFGISAFVYFIVDLLQFLKDKHKITLKIKPINLFLFVIAVGVIIYIVPQLPKYLETSVALESLDRLRTNSGDTRIEIWKYVLKNVNFSEYILFGKGGVTLINGSITGPHNGHLYWIISYGFIAYLLFMYLLFRKRKITPLKKYIWMIPILFGFTVNVMLGEIKMMGIVMLLIACSASQKYISST